MTSKYSVFLDEILTLNKEGKSNAEIGRILGLDSRRVSDQLKRLGMNAAERDYGRVVPTEYEKDYFVANAIGDGCIFKSKVSKNHRMTLSHSLKQKEYFLHKYDAVKDFIRTDWKIKTEYHKTRKKEYTKIFYQSKVNPYFSEMYSKWYHNGKKVIKKENVGEINEKVFALKYFDDGYKHRSGYYIAMDDYDQESLMVFMGHLKEEFGIHSALHKRNRVYFKKSEVDKIRPILLKYATKDLIYKI